MTEVPQVKYVRGSITPKIQFEVTEQGYCTYCSTEMEPTLLEVDHIIPVSRGGSSSDRGNLTAACFRCNHEKSDMTPDEWQITREMGGLSWPPPSYQEFSKIIDDFLLDAINIGRITTMPEGRLPDFYGILRRKGYDAMVSKINETWPG